MTTRAGQNPPKRLSKDISIANLAETGFLFCKACQRITERNEKQNCMHCDSPKVKWCPPVIHDEQTEIQFKDQSDL